MSCFHSACSHALEILLNEAPFVNAGTVMNSDKLMYNCIFISQLTNRLVFFPPPDEARGLKCGVLVHCLAGISRSVTVTVAYLMQKLNLSMNDAYDIVKLKKSNISPNFNFMGQLLDFERTLGLKSPCDNRVVAPTQPLYFTTTNHNVFQLDPLEST